MSVKVSPKLISSSVAAVSLKVHSVMQLETSGDILIRLNGSFFAVIGLDGDVTVEDSETWAGYPPGN